MALTATASAPVLISRLVAGDRLPFLIRAFEHRLALGRPWHHLCGRPAPRVDRLVRRAEGRRTRTPNIVNVLSGDGTWSPYTFDTQIRIAALPDPASLTILDFGLAALVS